MDMSHMSLNKIGRRFQVEKKLGEGGFGEVYAAEDEVTKSMVAVKIDWYPGQLELLEEAATYKKLEGVEGVPRLLATGLHWGKNYMAMELLGKDLYDISKNDLTEKDVLLIAYKSISILQRIHQRGIIHRDLKPENLMIGSHNKNQLYIVDFGIAKSYLNENGEHEDSSNAQPCGTPSYASLNCHAGKSQSRADDMESLAYVLLFLLQRSLPWQVEGGYANTFKSYYPKKASLTAKELFHGHSPAFARYLNYTRNLTFKEEPDYAYMTGLFEDELKRLGSNVDDSFDFSK